MPILSHDPSLRLPLIVAPMFLVSGPALVIAACRAGVIGTFPALNQRSSDGFEQWLVEISEALTVQAGAAAGPARYGVNLIVHQTNPRLEADLALCVRHRVPIVITSLGAVRDVVDAVHSYGGLVLHDIINLRHARKAAAAGVDGLIAVTTGAGGHAGTTHPFALIAEIRQFFNGLVILSGCLSTGRDLAAAIAIGADFGYMGTRFINTSESLASDSYQAMINEATSADIVYTDRISGIHANFLRASLEQAGLDPSTLAKHETIDFASEIGGDDENEIKAWKDIWSAGQGVGSIHDVLPVATLVERLRVEFGEAAAALQATWARCNRGV